MSMVVEVTRDSVCMADDVDAPHARRVTLPDETTLRDALATIARECLPSVEGGPVAWRAMRGKTLLGVASRHGQAPCTIIAADMPFKAGPVCWLYKSTNKLCC